MRTKRVYLAGHLNKAWEYEAKKLLEANEISTYYARSNSFDSYFGSNTTQEVQQLRLDMYKRNLMYLRYCDIILFSFKEIGSCFALVTELAHAYKENKIIVGFGNNIQDSASLLCTHIAKDLDEALEFINWYTN